MIKTVFPNFDKEMQANRYNLKTLAHDAGFNYMTLYNKVKTGENLTIDEAFKLKETLQSEQIIEELFKKVAI